MLSLYECCNRKLPKPALIQELGLRDPATSRAWLPRVCDAIVKGCPPQTDPSVFYKTALLVLNYVLVEDPWHLASDDVLKDMLAPVLTALCSVYTTAVSAQGLVLSLMKHCGGAKEWHECQEVFVPYVGKWVRDLDSITSSNAQALIFEVAYYNPAVQNALVGNGLLAYLVTAVSPLTEDTLSAIAGIITENESARAVVASDASFLSRLLTTVKDDPATVHTGVYILDELPRTEAMSRRLVAEGVIEWLASLARVPDISDDSWDRLAYCVTLLCSRLLRMVPETAGPRAVSAPLAHILYQCVLADRFTRWSLRSAVKACTQLIRAGCLVLPALVRASTIIQTRLMYLHYSDHDHDGIALDLASAVSWFGCSTEEQWLALGASLQLDSLPVTQAPVSTFQCTVCLESGVEPDVVVTTPCLHQFHKSCLRTWVVHYHRHTCPSGCGISILATLSNYWIQSYEQ